MFDAHFLGRANELLKRVLEDNYSLSNNHEISPELRDEIEEYLKSQKL